MGIKGNTVIDYVVGNKEVKESIRELRIEDKIDLDHHPMKVVIREKEK